MTHTLGRLKPTDFIHVDKYPARMTLPRTVEQAERVLKLPYRYRPRYNQGNEGACVGFAASWAQSIHNKRFYDAFWLYHEAQKIDEWAGEDYDGTSVRAGFDVLRNVGHKELHDPRHRHVPELHHGVVTNRWAYTVDEMRTAVQQGIPVVMGTNWYTLFDNPQPRTKDQFGRDEYWIPTGTYLGRIRGGQLVGYELRTHVVPVRDR